MTEKDLQVQEKQELQTKSETTRNVPIFVPAVDICESENELVLFADMPGVPMENVEIDLDNDQLTIRGVMPPVETKGSLILKEYSVGDYYRQFTLSNVIDQSRIEATMKDGVLRLALPKAEAAKPRKITVQGA